MRYLALFLVFVILLTSLTAFASEGVSEELTENQKIVKEVAYAYFRKGTKIHYDQATKTARRQIYASPEEPSAQRRVYLDCSGYANAIYYEAEADRADHWAPERLYSLLHGLESH